MLFRIRAPVNQMKQEKSKQQIKQTKAIFRARTQNFLLEAISNIVRQRRIKLKLHSLIRKQWNLFLMGM